MNRAVAEDQGPPPANRNGHPQGDKDVSPSQGESQNAAEWAEEEERCLPESGERRDEEEEQQQQQQQESSFSSCPGDWTPAGGDEDRRCTAAPDGGWGWAVLLASMLVLALTLAFPSCVGIFYRDLQGEFHASNTQTSWVPAIMTAVLHAGGPLCSMLVERFGCRPTVMVGGLLSGLGMAASALARTITHIYITSGITGLGFCLSFQPSVTILGHYFVRRRVFANALSSTGSAVGLSVLPLVSNFLLSQYGWRGSFLILGGVLLNCCVCGAVMRPVASGPSKPRLSQVSDRPNDRSQQQQQQEQEQQETGPKEENRDRTAFLGVTAFLHRHIGFDLLVRNARYRAFAVGVTWLTLGYVAPLVYLVPYAVHRDIGRDRAAFLMSVLGLVNIAVRPGAALVLGLPRFRGSGGGSFVYVFAGALLVNGLSNCVCGAWASFEALLAYAVTYGLSMSVGGSLLYTVLMDTVEMSRFPAALGLLCLLQSGTLLIGPPLAGMLVDHTGEYSYVFYACAVCVVSASLFLMGSFYFLDRERDKERREKSEKTPTDLHQKPVETSGPGCQSVASEGGTSENTVYVTNV